VGDPAPEGEGRWCVERRAEVVAYLEREGVEHGRVGDWPAWHLSPYVSIWAIESVAHAGSVGWWAICGDLPTDYISARTIKHPRDAMRALAERWVDVASYLGRGEAHPSIQLGSSESRSQLAPLLLSRAKLLIEWANDNAVWEQNAP